MSESVLVAFHNLKSIKAYICKNSRIKGLCCVKHCNHHPRLDNFTFSKNNVSLFSAMCSHCHHALEDEAPIRHLTAADHKFRTDTNPTDHRLTRYFFPFMNSVAINPLSDSVYLYKWSSFLCKEINSLVSAKNDKYVQ